jgi:hypothetical protein
MSESNPVTSKPATIRVPADEAIAAMQDVASKYGESGLDEDFPTLFKLWNANRQRAKWLVDKQFYDEDELVEPPLVIPEGLND